MLKLSEGLRKLTRGAALAGLVGASALALSAAPVDAHRGGGGGFHGGGFHGGGFHGGGFHGRNVAFHRNVGFRGTGFRGGFHRVGFHGGFHRVGFRGGFRPGVGGWRHGRWYGPRWGGWRGGWWHNRWYGPGWGGWWGIGLYGYPLGVSYYPYCSQWDYYYGYCSY